MKKYTENILKFIFMSFIIGWLCNYLYDKLEIAKKFDLLLNNLSNSSSKILDNAIQDVMRGSLFINWGGFLIFTSTVSIILFTLYIHGQIRNKTYKNNKVKIIVSTLFLMAQCYTLINIMLILSLNNTINVNTKNDLEIVRPYIDEREYLKLNSDLLQISNYEEYRKIDNEISNIAKKHNLNTH